LRARHKLRINHHFEMNRASSCPFREGHPRVKPNLAGALGARRPELRRTVGIARSVVLLRRWEATRDAPAWQDGGDSSCDSADQRQLLLGPRLLVAVPALVGYLLKPRVSRWGAAVQVAAAVGALSGATFGRQFFSCSQASQCMVTKSCRR
jgi:hypothetical protein